MAKYSENDFYLHVGKAIRKWAKLEYILWTYLAILLKVDQARARIVWMSFTSFRARRHLLLRLAETFADGEPLDQFRKDMQLAKKLSEKRNILAHSMMFQPEPNDHKITFIGEGEFDSGSVNFLNKKEFDISNIQRWHADIEGLQHDLMSRMRPFQETIESLPRTRQ